MKKYDYAFVLIICLFIIFRLQDINLPFFWDETGVYVKAIYYMQQHSISLLPNSIPTDLSRGHPLLFVFFYSLIAKTIGYHVYLIHSISLFFSVGTLLITYLINKRIISPFASLAGVILLMVQPVFLSLSMMALPEMMLAFFTTLSIYFFIQKRAFLFFVVCSMALLTKESAIILPFGLFVGDLISTYLYKRRILKKDFIQILWVFLPLLVFISFFMIQKLQKGWFFFPEHTQLISFHFRDMLARSTRALYFLLIKQGRFLWLLIIGFITFIICKKSYHKELLEKEYKVIITLGLFCMSVVAFTTFNFIMHRYLLYAIPSLSIITIYALNYLLPDIRKFSISVLLFCFVALYFMESKTFMLDENMSYKKIVNIQLESTKYAEDHQLYNVPIFANYPIYHGLQNPCMGYLSNQPFTNVHTPYDSLTVTAKDSIRWCLIYNPVNFDFSTLPFKVKLETSFHTTIATMNIYKVIN